MQWTGLFTGFFLISMCAVFVSYFLGSALNKYTGYLSFVGAAYLTYLAIRSLLQTYTASERKSELEEGGFFKSFATGLLVQLTNVKVMVPTPATSAISCLQAFFFRSPGLPQTWSGFLRV